MRLIFCALIFLGSQANARVFDLYNQSFATYFKGTYGMSQAAQNGFGDSSGNRTYFNSKEKINYGGEIGFIFPSKTFAWRLAFQVIAPENMHNIEGVDSSGSNLMTASSTLYGFFPMAYYEYYAYKTPTSRMIIAVGGGYGKVIMKNSYNLTLAGNTAYNNLGSFNEQASQLTYVGDISLGYEANFVENTTAAFDIGYRYSVANSLTYDNPVTDFTGAHASGDKVVNGDGSNKKINLSGVYAGIAFRFYFNY